MVKEKEGEDVIIQERTTFFHQHSKSKEIYDAPPSLDGGFAGWPAVG